MKDVEYYYGKYAKRLLKPEHTAEAVNDILIERDAELKTIPAEAVVMQKAYGQDVKRVIEIYLDNAQSQPKISIIDNGRVDKNLPIDGSTLNGIFPKTDGILLQRLFIKPYKEGYKIDADMRIGFSV